MNIQYDEVNFIFDGNEDSVNDRGNEDSVKKELK